MAHDRKKLHCHGNRIYGPSLAHLGHLGPSQHPSMSQTSPVAAISAQRSLPPPARSEEASSHEGPRENHGLPRRISCRPAAYCSLTAYSCSATRGGLLKGLGLVRWSGWVLDFLALQPKSDLSWKRSRTTSSYATPMQLMRKPAHRQQAPKRLLVENFRHAERVRKAASFLPPPCSKHLPAFSR